MAGGVPEREGGELKTALRNPGGQQPPTLCPTPGRWGVCALPETSNALSSCGWGLLAARTLPVPLLETFALETKCSKSTLLGCLLSSLHVIVRAERLKFP